MAEYMLEVVEVSTTRSIVYVEADDVKSAISEYEAGSVDAYDIREDEVETVSILNVTRSED